jgi:AbrB family looped-hinge helix DNA binding protein
MLTKNQSKSAMPHVTVTRGSQITLTKDVRDKLGIREGDVVTVNTMGSMAIITKRDASVWRQSESFLPEKFDRVLEDLREDTRKRLDRLGIT